MVCRLCRRSHIGIHTFLLAFTYSCWHPHTPAGGVRVSQELSVDPGSPCYVMRWLALADQLKLEAIEEMCMSKVGKGGGVHAWG
eukprot:366256-Chlamydomonas_euryale.AAC.10